MTVEQDDTSDSQRESCKLVQTSVAKQSSIPPKSVSSEVRLVDQFIIDFDLHQSRSSDETEKP